MKKTTVKKIITIKKVSLVKVIEELSEKLVELMGVTAEILVVEDKENEVFRVSLTTSDASGLLIGHHGDTLNSIQSILGVMVKQKTDEWVRIVVDCSGWREKQDDRLKELARQTTERVVQTGEPQSLYNLTATQRRVIHLELANESRVETESMGEGVDRYLIVKLKTNAK